MPRTLPAPVTRTDSNVKFERSVTMERKTADKKAYACFACPRFGVLGTVNGDAGERMRMLYAFLAFPSQRTGAGRRQVRRLTRVSPARFFGVLGTVSGDAGIRTVMPRTLPAPVTRKESNVRFERSIG
jgi:hypothetical protein